MRKLKYGLVLLIALAFMAILSACNPVYVSGDLTFNKDGSGTRKITGDVDKLTYDKDNGIAYYYLKLHGDDLKAWFEQTYEEKVPGSKDWLKVAVVDTGDSETITLSFDFADFEEYKTRLKALCFDEEQAAGYEDPTVIYSKGNVVGAYSESTGVMTGIMKSIHAVVLADDTVYDDNCTMDGQSMNMNGSGGVTSTNGIELRSGSNGPVLTVKVGDSKVKEVYETDGMIQCTGFEVVQEASAPAEENTVPVVWIAICAAEAVAIIALVVVVIVVAKKKK